MRENASYIYIYIFEGEGLINIYRGHLIHIRDILPLSYMYILEYVYIYIYIYIRRTPRIIQHMCWLGQRGCTLLMCLRLWLSGCFCCLLVSSISKRILSSAGEMLRNSPHPRQTLFNLPSSTCAPKGLYNC